MEKKPFEMTWQIFLGLICSACAGVVMGWFLSFEYVEGAYGYDHGGDVEHVMIVMLPLCVLLAMLSFLTWIRQH